MKSTLTKVEKARLKIEAEAYLREHITSGQEITSVLLNHTTSMNGNTTRSYRFLISYENRVLDITSYVASILGYTIRDSRVRANGLSTVGNNDNDIIYNLSYALFESGYKLYVHSIC